MQPSAAGGAFRCCYPETIEKSQLLKLLSSKLKLTELYKSNS